MPKKNSKRTLVWGIVLVAVVAAAFLGVRYWKARKNALPEGIVSGNGRIEAKLVDISAKEPLRVAEILVDEGDLVQPNQVLVRMDTSTLEAERAEAEAGIAAAQENLAAANAAIIKARSEVDLAKIEVDRATKLVKQGAGAQRELDLRRTKLETTQAGVQEAEANQEAAQKQVEEKQAVAKTVQTRIDDATLKSPVTGRVLYRLAETGEVLGAGGKALTLVNMEDIYMEIFLPAEEAASVKIGSEGRITVDYAPDRAVAGTVTFVSPEAQFTPKQVETKSEREKLMFRVKIQLPKEMAAQYVERIKTGIRGVGYVKVDPNAKWPPRLQKLMVPKSADQK